MQVHFSIFLQDPPSHLPFSILSPSPLLHSQLRMFGNLLLSLPHFLLPSQTKQAVWKATKLEPQSSPAPQTSPSPPPWQFILNTSVLVSWQCTLFKLHMRPQHAQTTMHAAIHSPNNSVFRRLLASAHHRNDDKDILAYPGVLRFPWMKPRQWEIPYPRLKFSNILPATMASHWTTFSFAWARPAGYSSSCCKCHSFPIGRN